MNRKLTTFTAIAATVLLAAACDNDKGLADNIPAKYITVSTSIGQMGRMATAEDGSQHFTAGDKISVYAWAGTTEPETQSLVVNGSTNTFDGTTWTAEPQMLWLDTSTPHYFISVYPAIAITDFKAQEYRIDPADQDAGDLLVAHNYRGLTSLTAPDGLVDLVFDHMMAKFVVNLSFRNQWGGTPDVESVQCLATALASVDFFNAQATAANAPQEDIALPAVTASRQYVSVMVPQQGFRKVTVNIGGKPCTYEHAGDIRLEQGKVTTLNLIVGRDRIEAADVTINDWEQGDVIDGGEAVD